MEKTRIAILGSNSHIAKGLICRFLGDPAAGLHLFTTSVEKTAAFLDQIRADKTRIVVHADYGDFLNGEYDLLINCVGIGTVKKLQNDYSRYFTVNEEYDNLAISCLRRKNPRALYVGLSSGAVYGGDFSSPADENTENRIRVNHVEKKDYYSIVRLNSEAKHRSFDRLNIVDLRIFSYFSRFYDPADGYFITDVIDCALHGKILTTGSVNFVRDYVHPDDLFALILKCLDAARNAGQINGAFDATSTKPVEKQEILNYFSTEYGLKYTTDASANHITSTGAKQAYYSVCTNAQKIGHRPQFSSLDAIIQESQHILRKATK